MVRFPSEVGGGAIASEIGVTVDVYPTSSSSSSSASSPDRGRALRDVSHVLAAYSCKGGIGKSTVAVNLAYRLSASGDGSAS